MRFQKLAVSLGELFEHVFNSNVDVNIDSESSEHVEKAANSDIFVKCHFMPSIEQEVIWSHLTAISQQDLLPKTLFFQQAL